MQGSWHETISPQLTRVLAWLGTRCQPVVVGFAGLTGWAHNWWGPQIKEG